MKKLLVGLAVAAVGAALTSVYYSSHSTEHPIDASTVRYSAARTDPVTDVSSASSQDRAPVNAASGTPAALTEADEALRGANDYLEFAESVLSAARDGDHDAQYYLARALTYCDQGYRVYFDRGKHRRTLDEALSWASTRPTTSMDEVRTIYDRCHRLKKSDDVSRFGKPAQWIEEAAKGGHALAQMQKARSIFVDAAENGRTANAQQTAEAKTLLFAALRSKDPEVLWELSDLAAFFGTSAAREEIDQWVWRVAACQRGYDCGPQAEWHTMQCRGDPNCQPYESGIDYIRRVNSADFDELELKARDLNAKLDAGKFDEIGD